MILTKEDYEKLEESGDLVIENRQEFSETSLDLRIDRLFRPNAAKAKILGSHDLSNREFIEAFCEEVPFDDGVVIKPLDHYLWMPMELFDIGPEFLGEVVSRSGWARLGSRVQSYGTDECLMKKGFRRRGIPVVSLSTTGTKVLIKRGDEISQFIGGYRTIGDHVPQEEINYLVDSGEFEITRDGKKLHFPDLDFLGGMVLTMGDKILVYNPKNVLVPGEPKEDDFEEIELKATEPLFLRKGTFFISASRESVSIPNEYMGYVTEFSTQEAHQILRGRGSVIASQPFTSNPNAPYIQPRAIFNGVITFENIMRTDGYVYSGMRQSEFQMRRLHSSVTEGKESTYNNQEQATRSKA